MDGEKVGREGSKKVTKGALRRWSSFEILPVITWHAKQCIVIVLSVCLFVGLLPR